MPASRSIAQRVSVAALVFLAAQSISAQTSYTPYTFTTLAGVVNVGVGSADGTGSAARFNGPMGVAVDGFGNVYVADSSNDTIRKITPAGVVTTFAGTAGAAGSADGTGSAASFNDPTGVAVDVSGNVYVADSGNDTIREITTGGVVSTLAGTAGKSGSADGPGSAARFAGPTGVAVDGSGNVYVADSGNDTIREIMPGGIVTTLAGTAGKTGSVDATGGAARFNGPFAVAVDGFGNVYVADTSNDTIREIMPGGVVSTLAGTPGVRGSADGTGRAAQFYNPLGVAVDGSGNVYVGDRTNDTIREIMPGGVVTTLAGTPEVFGSADGTGSAASFYYPAAVAVDGSGNVYVADEVNDTIREIMPGGVVTTFAGASVVKGSADGMGSAASFNNPAAVAVDGSGNVYVADEVNDTIRKITPVGVVTTFAGTAGVAGSADGTGSAAQFNLPYGIAVDGTGNVYVGELGNNTIRKITPDGVVTTLAGTPGVRGSTDGTGSAAQFSNPVGLAVDGSGNVYVADEGNYTIREITPGGVVTTLAGTAGKQGIADGTGSAARFASPFGVAVDGAGNVYVADGSNSTIRKITSGGVVTTLAGMPRVTGSADGTGSAARFNGPNGVAVDGAGNIYVADRFNCTIREITPAGIVTTLAGVPSVRGNVDGTGSAARFNVPNELAVDGSGNVYVADQGNETIRWGASAPPTLTSVTTASGSYGQSFSYTMTFSGTLASYSASGLPAGLSLNSITGVISGTPTAAGTFTVTLGATNGAGTGSGTLSLVIAPPQTTAAITTQPSSQATLSGGTAVFSVGAIGPQGDLLQYQWYLNGLELTDGTLPDGSTILGSQAAVLALTGVGSAEAGSYTVVVSETDPIYGPSSATSDPATLAVALPQVTSISPATALAGTGDTMITVNGAEFNSGDNVLWTDGTQLETTYVSGNILAAIVPAADLATNADIATELVSVQSASGDSSNLEAFSVVSTAVGQVQASVATPGGSATDSTAPTTTGNAGVTATLQNTSTSAPAAAISVANYSSNPTSVAPTIDVGGQYVDVQVTSVTASDTVTAYFYYPSTVTGANADHLQLLYFDGTNWDPVLSSGGSVPDKSETPNLNGTVSGGQFTVVFDDTSTPTITNLSGTVFTPSIVTIPPVIQSVTPSPAYLVPANNQMVPVTIAVSAADQFYPNPASAIVSVSSNEASTNGTAEWQITGPLTLNLQASRLSSGSGRIYTITVQTTDSAGNMATAQTEVIVPKDGDALTDPPAIVTQPQSQTVNAGGKVMFSVATATALPVTYQWLFNGVAIQGATGMTVTLPSVTLSNTGVYTVAATNSIGTTTSHKAKLTVDAGPAFTTQPQSLTAVVGAKVAFTAAATGGPKPHYQWFLNGVTVSGGKSGTLTINKIKISDAGSYTVEASNSFGSATSNPALLTVNAPPKISTQPQSQTVSAGTNVVLTVVASGTPVLSYQWFFDGTPISGGTNETLPLTNLQPSAAGGYTVTITNFVGSVSSHTANIKVKDPTH